MSGDPWPVLEAITLHDDRAHPRGHRPARPMSPLDAAPALMVLLLFLGLAQLERQDQDTGGRSPAAERSPAPPRPPMGSVAGAESLSVSAQEDRHRSRL